MSASEPDPKTIDAWLNGELSAEDAAVVEAYFDANPGVLRSTAEVEELLPKLAAELLETDADLDALVDRFKTNPGMEQEWMPSELSWKGILKPMPEGGRKILGMLGPYEVERLIATGGMGIIFEAREPKLDRVVALKVLAPQLASVARARERFLREARAAARLEHENILPIYAVHDGELPYFSMRYVDGGTLEEKLRTVRKLELEKLKSLTLQVAAALETAHAAGIIHRDIKPANILFDKAGEKLWVCDFGIARSSEDPSLTYEGNVAGTPQYMSPEQADGKEVDSRSDLFSLGAVLYRCATGKQAFAGETTAAVLKNVSESTPRSADELDEGVPKWLANLIGNLLAKDAANRPVDATTVIGAVENEAAPAPVCSSGIRLWWLVLPALVAVLALIFWPRSEGEIAPAGTVQIEGSVERYSSLAAALDAAQEGATLVLSGVFDCSKAVLTPAGKALQFTSAADGAPVMVAGVGSALIARGPVSFNGVTFSRPAEIDSSEPIIVVRGAGRAKFENCEFQYLVTGTKCDASGLALDGVADAKLTRCVFRMPGAYGINLAGDSTRTAVEQSVFVVREAVHRESGQLTQLSFAASVLRCDRLFGDTARSPFGALTLSVSDSIIDSRDTLLWIPDEQLEPALEKLEWKGTGNVYASGMRSVVKTPRTNPQVEFSPGYARSFAEMIALSPGSEEVGGGALLIFEGLSARTPHTVGELRDALRDVVKSPATAALAD